MRLSLAILAGLTVALGGCEQPSLIIIEIAGEYEVPNEVNALELLVTAPDDGAELGRVNLNLGSEHTFPIEVSLEPSPDTPGTLETEVRALLDGQPVAAVKAIHDWQAGKVSRVALPPLEPL